MTGVFLGVLVFFPFLGGLLAAVAGKKHADYRDFLADIVVVFEFLTAFGLFSIQSFVGEATFAIDGICGMGLHFQADGFRLIYALVAAFMWLMTAARKSIWQIMVVIPTVPLSVTAITTS